jgi:hypothetical protein
MSAQLAAYLHKPAMSRAANERIAQRAASLHFASRVPMICECANPSCREMILIDLADYWQLRADPRRYLTAPGHVLEKLRL